MVWQWLSHWPRLRRLLLFGVNGIEWANRDRELASVLSVENSNVYTFLVIISVMHVMISTVQCAAPAPSPRGKVSRA